MHSVNEDGRPDRNHLVQRLDVLVPQPHAAVTDRVANALRLVGPVQRVSIAHVEPMGSQHPAILPLIRAVRRDHDITTRDYLATLYPRLDRYDAAVRVLADHVGPLDGDRR